MKKLTAKQRREIEALKKQPDSRIDTSDIPEVRDWSKAVRGKFFRPGISRQIPIYLDPEIQEFLSKQAARRRMETSALVNKLLKKDVELLKAGKQ